MNSLPHPLPLGKYKGSCRFDPEGAYAVFTFQAVTLRMQPKPAEPKNIITPGDQEYGVTLSEARRLLP